MASGSASQSKEFSVRAPKNTTMTYGIVKFNPNNKVDFTAADQSVKIERENNHKDYKAAYDMDVAPKFGAGSEFGREEREEARRKKYGIHRRRYNVDAQPWLMKLGAGKAARKFKGTKEGGILENASYYIFTQCSDGAFDAFPVKDWHSFNPVIKYKHLNIDEAEEEYTRRDKTLNYFNIMVKRRVKGTDGDEKDGDDDEEKQKGKKKKKKGKDFLLTDMDDWAILSEDENDDSEEESKQKSDSDESGGGKNKKKGKRRKTKKDYKTNSGDEAVEESDDEDEGREVDYMTDTDSDDDEMYAEKGRGKLDKYKQTGVEDEEGLQKIIASGDEEEAEKEESGNEGSDDEKKGSQSSSDSSSDSESDPDKDSNFTSALFMQKKDASPEKDKKDKDKKKSKKDKKDKKGKNGRKRKNSGSSDASNLTNSRSATPTTLSQGDKKEDSHIAKRAKMETPPISSADGLTEDMVRRYLKRKPMTTGEIMKKFKNVGLTKEKLVINITEILKKLNPEKKTIDGKLHLWIKKSE